jgi:hypothetical protein
MGENELLIQAKEKKRKLENSRFKQQTLPGWRPVPTFWSSLIVFLVIGISFVTFGIVLLCLSADIKEASVIYHNH